MKLLWALIIAIIIGLGAVLSDRIFDRVKVSVLSRKAIHMAAGVGILIAPFVFEKEDVWWPLGIAIFFLVALTILHFTRASFGYGVRTPGRFVELWFCISCVVIYASVWRIDPWLATAPLLWLSFGDGFTGLARWKFYHIQGEKGWAGTVAMGVVCLLIALMVHPYFVGAIGALVATAVEKVTPSRGRWIDDNYSIPLSGAVVIVGLSYLIGAV